MRKIFLVKVEGTNSANVIQSFSENFETVEVVSPSEINTENPIIILPGNGSFKHYVDTLKKHKWEDYLSKIVNKEIDAKLLSICSGFQVLGNYSDESPNVQGLNILDFKFESITGALGSKLVINIGRKKISIAKNTYNFNGNHIDVNFLQQGLDMPYFVHGYAAKLDSNVKLNEDYCYLKAEIGEHEVIAGVINNHIMATQFHPELSGTKWREFMVEFMLN